MNRDEMTERLRARREPWDVIVIGGGATGAGVAVDAATRGYSVLLLEGSDFGKGTSSRSTKLIHGGVRYLARRDLALVKEALRERSILRANAPHAVSDLAFILPAYAWWERPYFGCGLKLYDLLAWSSTFGRSKILSRRGTLDRVPTIRRAGLAGGVEYHDGQFDDARLLINLLQTAAAYGATVLNYARVTGLLSRGDGAINGVVFVDAESDRVAEIPARVVVNAAGPFVDDIRRMAWANAEPLIVPSQGIHLVFPRSFLPGQTAIVAPRVGQGRVMFAMPWHGHTLIGTTDTPIDEPVLEPRPREDEIDAVLDVTARYLDPAPTRADVLSAFAGIRPLVRGRETAVTAALSRDHTLRMDPPGLVTTTGGKWTTYRRMAQEAVDFAAAWAGLPQRPCVTETLPIAGADDGQYSEALAGDRSALAAPLHPVLPWTSADVVRAVRREMARTVEDVLARRCRALFLNAGAAREMSAQAAAVAAGELGRDEAWQRQQVAAFDALAARYQVSAVRTPSAG